MAKYFETIEKKLEAYQDDNYNFKYKIENNNLSVDCNTSDTIKYFVNLISNHIDAFSDVTIRNSSGYSIKFRFKNNILYIVVDCSRLLKYVSLLSAKYPIFLYNDFAHSHVSISDNNILVSNGRKLSNDAKILIDRNETHISFTIQLLHHPNIYIHTKSDDPCFKFYNIISDEEFYILQELM